MPENQSWNQRYLEGNFPWDLGGPAPSLVALAENGKLPFVPGGRILVPGCGRGHDVLYLASLGYDALGLDFAPKALEFGRSEAASRGLETARFVQGDFFNPPEELLGAFDGLYELTCYCAIEPSERDRFAKSSAAILKEGGLLLSLLFPLEEREGGPPYGVSVQDLQQRHEAEGFTRVRDWEPQSPHPAREGRVRWVLLLR